MDEKITAKVNNIPININTIIYVKDVRILFNSTVVPVFKNCTAFTAAVKTDAIIKLVEIKIPTCKMAKALFDSSI